MFGLAFLSPVFLAGLVAASIPLILHLFHRRADPIVDFAAMRYLRHAPVEQARRRTLRELLLLMLRVTALCLLALAFARPYFTEAAAAPGAPATIVLVDTSLSMSAPSQFARAQAIAEQALRTAPAAGVVGVIAFATGADVVAPLSTDRAGAIAAVTRIEPGAGATDYVTALSRASELMASHPGRIVMVTDLQQSGWDSVEQGAVPEGVTVEVKDAGAVSRNLAIRSLRIDGGGDAVAIVQNFSSSPAVDQVSFAIDGERIGAVPVTIPANGTADARLTLKGQMSGALTASVSDRDGYAIDNTRYAILDASVAPSILAVTSSGQTADALYLQRALSVAEGPGAFRFRTISGPSFSDLGPDGLDDVDAVAILGTRGLEHQGRDRLAGFVRRGGGALITFGPDVDPAVLKEALGGVIATSWRARAAVALRFAPEDSRHPIFRLFGGVGTLANVDFEQAALIDTGEGSDVLARYSDGSAALVEEDAGSGRVLIFASDLNRRWNDFPLQPAFVPFVHEAVRYLAASRSSRDQYLVGELSAAEGAVPGITRIGTAHGKGRRVAINVDPRESDPARMSADAFGAAVARLKVHGAQHAESQAREREDTQRLWQYGLLVMLVSLVAESIVGRRLG